MDCEKINLKINISIVFFHELSKNQLHFFGEMGNEKIMSF